MDIAQSPIVVQCLLRTASYCMQCCSNRPLFALSSAQLHRFQRQPTSKHYLSVTPSLHLSSPLHCGNHYPKPLINVSREFYDPRACLLICSFVSYVEPHFSSFYLFCRSHDNTALTPQLYVVSFFAWVQFVLLCVCSHCSCVLLICTCYGTS